MKNPLRFAKINSQPTIHSWTQGYTAGNLIAIISLTQATQNTIQELTEISLAILGKDLINTLEAEYFTLETKNLTTIKQAISTTIEKVPQDIYLSFGVAVIIENILYLFQYGPGKIIMKRKDKSGVLLEQNEINNLIAGSGFIEDGDVIVLGTKQFYDSIPIDSISPFLYVDKLSELTDKISPLLYEKQITGAAAIAFSYSEESVKSQELLKNLPSDSLVLPQTQISKKVEKEYPLSPKSTLEVNKVLVEGGQQTDQLLTSTTQEPEIDIADASLDNTENNKAKFHLSHARKLFLTIVIILIIVLIGSLYFSTRKQKQATDQKLFSQTVIPAQKKYDEGLSLLALNQNLALEDYQMAKTLLQPALGKFPLGSQESQEANALNQKISDALSQTTQTASQDAKQTDASNSPLLSALLQHSTEKYVTEDTKNIYLGDNTGITAQDKASTKTITTIANNSDWKDIGGLATYLGNFYILDRNNGILKYVPGGNGLNKSQYFQSTTPNLNKANDIAIDGSIWIIFSDGSINKYTKGVADSFTIKGIDKPLNNPSRIYTSIDSTKLYVLDNGNKRIVILDKKGNFIQQYSAGVIATAQDFQVMESQKKIYILSNQKIWELDMK